MKILAVGDLVGESGVKKLKEILPSIKQEKQIDFVIVNAENSASGMGITISIFNELKRLNSVKVLLRAHGEPPETYKTAKNNNIEIIDATCPVVLKLQRRIKQEYDSCTDAQIVIFGKPGHAEVLGLVGQTNGKATVIANMEDAKKLDFNRDIFLYSQTTKSLDEFHLIIKYIQEHISPNATFKSFDTICRQVANRMPNISMFAQRHDLILFVLLICI